MKHKAWFFYPVLLMMIWGCGYRFSGGGDFPFNIKSVFVPVFENRSSETGIVTMITNVFLYELTRRINVSFV